MKTPMPNMNKCGMLAPKPLLCLALLQFALCLRAQAQSYSIDWYKIAGGGGVIQKRINNAT